MIVSAALVVDVSPPVAFAIAHLGVWPRPASGLQRELHLGGHVPLTFEFHRVEPPYLVTERMVAGPAFLRSVEAKWTFTTTAAGQTEVSWVCEAHATDRFEPAVFAWLQREAQRRVDRLAARAADPDIVRTVQNPGGHPEFRVGISTDRFDETCRFWGEHLVCPVIHHWEEPGRGKIFQVLGSASIEISEGPATTPNIFLSVQVTDADAAFAALAPETNVHAGPTDQPWGHRNFTVIDPNGLKLTFFSLTA